MEKWITDFIDLWKGIEVDEFQKALDLKYKNLPKSIYKYRYFDKDDYAINNLVQNKIWLSSPNKFNDPYDSLVSTDTNSIIEKVFLKSQTELCNRRGFTPEILSALNCLPGTQNQINKVRGTGISVLKQMMNFFRNSINVCSFSENKDNILMWSHYSDNHSGFCIEYDLSTLENGNKLIDYLFPIIYTEKLFEVTDIISSPMQGKSCGNFMYLIPLYKSKAWEYEKEWRLVLADFQKSINEFSMPIPKAIYLGSKIDSENKENLIEIAKAKKIEVYQMKMLSDEFKLNAHKIDLN